MGFSEDLTSEVRSLFDEQWQTREGNVIPEVEDLKLGNDGVFLDATILYADMAESTELVNKYKAHFAAEVYKSYLVCCSKIIKAHGGQITAYDGDRVMGVYIGNSKNTSAAKTALRINYAVEKIIQPAIKQQYPSTSFLLKHGVGIDTSRVLVARIGVRNDNDLVWIGRSANYAAKLCSLRNAGHTAWLTDAVYSVMNNEAKFHDGQKMWTEKSWPERGITVYGSNWYWKPIN